MVTAMSAKAQVFASSATDTASASSAGGQDSSPEVARHVFAATAAAAGRVQHAMAMEQSPAILAGATVFTGCLRQSYAVSAKGRGNRVLEKRLARHAAGLEIQ